ncbi:MAG: aminoacetone oxidase family FAD-binding enzyme [Phycisphaeraceae bacterium]|nr:aminoacetone oxidase family FAD-binding enzyme [Phycisphaeraceae bacterium]MCB9848756.1 aminoacetone oxidase family FAD-binding enzyme [Phycisphaeraceae bacterium]
MAAISAGRAARDANRSPRIVALDGARTLGAKILVAGGGRCNVTHESGDARDFAGGSPNAINKVLRAFTFDDTVRFFRELDVELKCEDTGKLFPVTDSARTVLTALLDECRRLGVELRHPWRVERIEQVGDGLRLHSNDGQTLDAARIILATGGKALPKSGSDGVGYTIARSLGHTLTPHVFPALAPLKLDQQQTDLVELTGVATRATIEVVAATGKRRYQTTGDTLITHWGLSGPAPMDASRHLTAARLDDPGATLVINWLPGETPEQLDRRLLDAGKRHAVRLLAPLPERLAKWVCRSAGVDPATPCSALTRAQRKSLVDHATRWRPPITGDRGFTHAEATAGGVPLDQVHLGTMQSRRCDRLCLCGEVLDVDGRIGGFNFQWAWSSGFLAGKHAISAAQ